MFSFLEIHVLGDIPSGLEFAEVAVELARRTGAPQAIAPPLFAAAAFCLPHKYPVRTNVEWLEEAYRLAMVNADMLWAGFCANIAITHTGTFAGVHESREVIARYQTLLQRLNNPHALSELIIVRQFMRLMAGETAGPDSFDDRETSEKDFREWLFGLQDPIPVGYYHAYKHKALCLAGLWEQAAAVVEETDKAMVACTGQLILTESVFYTFLALAHDVLRDRAREDGHRGAMNAKLERMRRWAEFCPSNFRQKVLMMEAMLSRIAGRHDEAKGLLAGAATTSDANGWPLDVALARELTARTAFDAGDADAARRLLAEAREAYDRYGASIKTVAIDRELGRNPS